MWETFKVSADYANRLAAIVQYNAANKWTKKGISITTVKFGIGWEGGQVISFLARSKYLADIYF